MVTKGSLIISKGEKVSTLYLYIANNDYFISLSSIGTNELTSIGCDRHTLLINTLEDLVVMRYVAYEFSYKI